MGSQSLQESLTKLRAAKATAEVTEGARPRDNCLFLGNRDDEKYLPFIKGMFSGYATYFYLDKMEMLAHLKMYCEKLGVNKVVTTNRTILSKLLGKYGKDIETPSLDSYAGSFYSHDGLDIVIVNPLAQIFSVPYGKFLLDRHISKLTRPNEWIPEIPFNWSIPQAGDFEEIYHEFSLALFIAADIETYKRNLAIRCCGFTCVSLDSSGNLSSRSIVIPLDSEFNLVWCKKFLSLPVAKVFQNGKYDCSYLLRYNAPPVNWIGDTMVAMHCTYAELPKDLGFLNAFWVRKSRYWKDLANTSDLFEYYKYNALDTWATANVWISWILTAPDWAKRNYLLEFPLMFPCLLAEMTGLRRDPDKLLEARTEVNRKEDVELTKLRTYLTWPTFNPGSPVQVMTVLKILGCGDIGSTNEKDLYKAKVRHPLNRLIIDSILEVRGLRKLRTNYLRLDSDADKGKDNGSKEFRGRILYALNPFGTDTGRPASKEHHFWTGLQIQNIPRGIEVKQTLRADEGFYLGECDLEQAESRDTAYISGDTTLIAAVSGTRDFHSVNASAFFGVTYESIYDDTTRKTKDKKLRDTAKRVNHGANYNMGPGVLVDTMGVDKVFEAGKFLKLPYFDPLKIAEELLRRFHATYRKLRGGVDKPYYEGTFYAWVVRQVMASRMLISRAFHHTEYNLAKYSPEQYIDQGDWSRYCFGNPEKNKRDLNSYTAHPPQSLNSRTLNEAWMKVFYEIALPNPECFRLHAQIHDSILFSYKVGREDLADKVRECMEIPVTIRDVSGTTRTFTVPASLKLGMTDKKTGEFKRATYWSETE